MIRASVQASLALMLLSTGCGSRPSVPPDPVAGGVAWTTAHGGAWVSTCATADGFAALRAGGLDRWSVPADGPPKRLKSVVLPWPAAGAPGRFVRCPESVDAPLAVQRFAGPALILDGDGWTEGAAALDGDPDPAWSGPINGRAMRLARGGWSWVEGGVAIAGRPTAGDFADATWDAERGILWAVGPSGLWRWSKERPRLTPIPLPGGARRALMRVWRDGPFVWVVDDSRIGYALDLADGMARLARPPGPVRMSGPERMALIDGRRIAVVLGGETLTVDERALPLGGRVDAFTPLGGAEVLIGLGDAIERWRVVDEPKRVERWVVGDRTRRIIVSGSRVFAVGGYGLLMGTAELPDRPPRPTGLGTVVVE